MAATRSEPRGDARPAFPDSSPGGPIPLKVLIVEDSALDAELVVRELRHAGFQSSWKRVQTAATLTAALGDEPWDIVLSDFRMPRFDGLAAFEIVRGHDADLPFLMVSGAIGEETAVAAMKRGVNDYIMKDNLARLGAAVLRELEDARTRRERLRLEEAAYVASQQWRATFDALSEAIFLADASGRITRCNQAFRDLVGKPFQDILGRPCAEIVHENGVPIANCPFALMKASRKRESATMPRGGRWFRLTTDPVWDEEGGLLNSVHVMEDITEARIAEETLQANEAHYRELADSLPLVIYETDLKGRITFMNRTGFEQSGYAEDDFRAGLPVLSLIAEHDRPRAAERIGAVIAGGKPAPSEFIAQRKDRTTFPVLVITSLMTSGGLPIGIRGTVMDITERKKAEAEKREYEVHLRHQQKLEAIGTLAGGVAHEINNPINGIMNYAQLIADQSVAGAPVRGFADEILRETERVSAIVRSLLTFARREKQSHSPALLADIVEATLKLTRVALRRDQIELTVDIPADLPKIKCRSQQIQQVLMNLITNARDALNAKATGYFDGKRIEIRAQALEKDGRTWVRTTVTDGGVGIPPDVRERLFEPFFTTKPKDVGTGLGLSISHGIVRDHRGELAYDSEPGVGTRFHVDLPADGDGETNAGDAPES